MSDVTDERYAQKPTRFTILGERCSGTKYLMKLIELNFGLPVTWDYGWKHFFGFADYSKDSDQTLFIGIVRGPIQWMGSLFREKHHVCQENRDTYQHFLLNEWWSYFDSEKDHGQMYGKEIMEDRNIHTHERYKNLFELRSVKSKFLLDEMPNKVKYYILIRYEDILKNPLETMQKISQLTGLPLPSNHIKGHDPRYVPHHYKLSPEISVIVDQNLDKTTENRLGYLL